MRAGATYYSHFAVEGKTADSTAVDPLVCGTRFFCQLLKVSAYKLLLRYPPKPHVCLLNHIGYRV